MTLPAATRLSGLRLYGLLSLALVAACAALSPGAPWPLGAAGGAGSLPGRAAALALGLAVGWGVPGICLALSFDPRTRGAALLGRGLGLGAGYLLGAHLVHSIAFGHGPGRWAWLMLLAAPALVAILARPAPDATPSWAPLAAFVVMAAVAAAFWPKLTQEALNGDGTEAYEIARSLREHPAPYWDLERWEPPGRFGTPAVNPFFTNSALVSAEMAVLGRGELAPRLILVPALVIAGVLAAALLGRPGWSASLYVAAVVVVYALWNAYWVGYEQAYTDLAEPAATDTLMVALWLAGFAEVTAGVVALGVAFLVLSAGILYSAPVLSAVALAALAWRGTPPARAALRLWLAAGITTGAVALLFGIFIGDAGDWFRQVRSEYWEDFVDQSRRTPTPPVVIQLLLVTGGLPALALLRLRRLSRPSRALLATSGAYLALVLLSSYKNLHYLAPLPFLLAPAALEASGLGARLAATALVAVTGVLSWPSAMAVHPENAALGRVSCIDGLDYERACLAGDILYQAFDRLGHGGRFGVGKHTFVRYALDLGGGDGCLFRLSDVERPGWIAVAGGDVQLSTRDPDAYARWRLMQPSVPRSWLFPRPSPLATAADASAWPDRIDLRAEPGVGLLLERSGPRRRLLVPIGRAAERLVLEASAPVPAGVALRVNGVPLSLATPISASVDAPPWRRGWNVLEIDADVALEAMSLQGGR
jgi:hypothetical protein